MPAKKSSKHWLLRIIEGAIGIYLILPGAEDVASGGTLFLPSILVGAYLLADAFEVKIKL